jgi:SAM-dependent methyltransferase
MDKNYDIKVIDDFGAEWSKFSWLNHKDLEKLSHQFNAYTFTIRKLLKKDSGLIICDFGAGSGRWSYFLVPFSKKLYILEPAKQAFEIIEKRFKKAKVVLLNEDITDNSIPVNSLDLAVALGVLHHIPDPTKALISISNRLKPGGIFLGYMYYSLENRPVYYRLIWKLTDIARKKIAIMPNKMKFLICNLLALFIYLPFARANRILNKFKIRFNNLPLSHYTNLSFKAMRNDALDRFGTKLELRFSKEEIVQMLITAKFDPASIIFSPHEPYFTFSATKLMN